MGEGEELHHIEEAGQDLVAQVREDPKIRALAAPSHACNTLEGVIGAHVSHANTVGWVEESRDSRKRLSKIVDALSHAKPTEFDPETGRATVQEVLLTGQQVATVYDFVRDPEKVTASQPGRELVEGFTDHLVRIFPTAPIVEKQPTGIGKVIDKITGGRK